MSQTRNSQSSDSIIFEQTSSYEWDFPPTLNRGGRAKYPRDIKHISHIRTNLFKEPTIVMSDLHSTTPELFKKLFESEKIDMTKYHVITVGDMAGTRVMGSDGNPTPQYAYLLNICKVKSLTIVQGNHDLPPKDCELSTPSIKQQVSNCIIRNGMIHKTVNGTVGGVNGTISRKPHPYKMPPENYYRFLKRYIGINKRPDILLTHDTPRFFHEMFVKNKGGQKSRIPVEFIGKDEIYDLVLKIRPKIYIYGHCHHKKMHTVHEGIHFLNVDARVVIFDPVEEETS